MAGISDDSSNADAAILAFVRFLQEGLSGAPAYSGDTELLRSFLELMRAFMSETRPTLTHALERAQKTPLASAVLDELMAAAAKIDADRMATVRSLNGLSAAGGTSAQMLRRSIAGVEHVSDAALALTKRVDRLLEEFKSGHSDRS